MTDPSISLAVRTPPPIDPLEQYGKALAIKGHLQQQQIGQQQLQSGALTIQQQQMQLEALRVNNEAWKAAMPEAPSATPASPPASASAVARPAATASPATQEAPEPGGEPTDQQRFGGSQASIGEPAESRFSLGIPGGPSDGSFNNPNGTPVSYPNMRRFAPGAGDTAPQPSAIALSRPAAQPATPAQAPPVTASTPGPTPGTIPTPNGTIGASRPTIAASLAAPAPAPPVPATPAAPAAPKFPSIDFDKAAQYLAQHGQGSQIPAMRSAQAKYAQELALSQKTQAEAHSEQTRQVAQAFEAVQDAPDDQKEQAYQLALQTALPLAQRYGLDASHFPPHYDPATTPAFIAQTLKSATKLEDFSRQAEEMAKLQHQLSSALPKTTKEVTEQYNSDLSVAKDQTSVDLVNKRWTAVAGVDPTGTISKVLKAIQVDKWSQDTAQDAAAAALTPEQRATNKHQADMLADRQKRTQATIDENKRKAALESTAQHKDNIQNMMRRALADSLQGGGKGPDDAIANVSDPAFYQNDPIGSNRGAVLKALDEYKRGQLSAGKSAEQLANAERARKMRERFNIGGTDTTPAATKPTPTTAPAPTTAQPATTKTYTESQIRQDATRRGFKSDGPEADAAVKAARAKGSL